MMHPAAPGDTQPFTESAGAIGLDFAECPNSSWQCHIKFSNNFKHKYMCIYIVATLGCDNDQYLSLMSICIYILMKVAIFAYLNLIYIIFYQIKLIHLLINELHGFLCTCLYIFNVVWITNVNENMLIKSLFLAILTWYCWSIIAQRLSLCVHNVSYFFMLSMFLGFLIFWPFGHVFFACFNWWERETTTIAWHIYYINSTSMISHIDTTCISRPIFQLSGRDLWRIFSLHIKTILCSTHTAAPRPWYNNVLL